MFPVSVSISTTCVSESLRPGARESKDRRRCWLGETCFTYYTSTDMVLVPPQEIGISTQYSDPTFAGLDCIICTVLGLLVCPDNCSIGAPGSGHCLSPGLDSYRPMAAWNTLSLWLLCLLFVLQLWQVEKVKVCKAVRVLYRASSSSLLQKANLRSMADYVYL